MKIGRAYHSMTVLGDGSIFTVGGSWHGGKGDKDGELWTPSTNEWTLKTGIPAGSFLTNDMGGVYRSDNHLWLFTAPNGLVFHAGPSYKMHWVDASGSGSVTQSVNQGSTDRMNGNALMYDIGKILVVGGAPNYDRGSGTKDAYTIDINGAEASVTKAGDMKFQQCRSAKRSSFGDWWTD